MLPIICHNKLITNNISTWKRLLGSGYLENIRFVFRTLKLNDYQKLETKILTESENRKELAHETARWMIIRQSICSNEKQFHKWSVSFL